MPSCIGSNRISSWYLVALIAIICNRVSAEDGPFAGKTAGAQWSANALKMPFCWCPAGKFTMGSPENEVGRDINENCVDVVLTHGFWLAKFEVTQAEYHQVMQKRPSKFRGDRRPVETVTWHEAKKFCEKLTAMERSMGRLPIGWRYCLPTEAQWEYACRAVRAHDFALATTRKN